MAVICTTSSLLTRGWRKRRLLEHNDGPHAADRGLLALPDDDLCWSFKQRACSIFLLISPLLLNSDWLHNESDSGTRYTCSRTSWAETALKALATSLRTHRLGYKKDTPG
jgi:hypothetical protein